MADNGERHPNRGDTDNNPTSEETRSEPAFSEADFAVDDPSASSGPEKTVDSDRTDSTENPSVEGQTVYDMTLTELIGWFWKQPRNTWSVLRDVLDTDYSKEPSPLLQDEPARGDSTLWDNISNKWLLVGLYGLAVMAALSGNSILHSVSDARRSEDIELAAGLPWLFVGFAIWLMADVYGRWSEIVAYWRTDSPATMTTESDTASSMQGGRAPWYMNIPLIRPVLLLGGIITSVLVWSGTSGNNFPTPVFYLWLISIACWSLAIAPLDFNPLTWASGWIDRLRRFDWRTYRPVLLALLLIMVFATAFRVWNLAGHPLEMTDDHVEKILDAGLVRDGFRPIFFANNGGREPFQMYAIALASYLPGLGINHFTIKVVAVIESLLTIPVLFWMGYELLNLKNKRLRLLVGLLLAAFVAVSYWHVAVTRLGLRIVLTPLITALLLIYLARGIRRNQRADFIKAGLILGFGLYTYQAVRMLPIVIVIAVMAAIVFRARDWRARVQYVVNLTSLVMISFVMFLPMFHYSVEFPDLFWRRATGRLMGDDIIEERLPDGEVIIRNPSIEERWEAFQGNLPTIASNIRNALLMFNWKGDVATINGVSNAPSMSLFGGAFLILGLAAWCGLMLRRGDTVHGLIPLVVFIMLLPSALSIAFPVENPSHTRTSGAIPLVYLLAALPLALLVDEILKRAPSWRGKVASVLLCGVVLIGSYNANTYLYFEVYPPQYKAAFDPYTEPGQVLEGFAESDGAFGNAFMIGYPHWWSHRAIGLAAGLEEQWPNGVVNRTDIPRMLRDGATRTDKFRYYPARDLMFFYAPEDTDSGEYLFELFPDGQVIEYSTYAEADNFMLFRAPALEEEGLQQWLETHLPE
jgi:hypothetical protein